MNQHEILDLLKAELLAAKNKGHEIDMNTLGVSLKRLQSGKRAVINKDSSSCGLCAIGAHLLGKRLELRWHLEGIFAEAHTIAFLFAESVGRPIAYGLGFLYGSGHDPLTLDSTKDSLESDGQLAPQDRPEFNFGYRDGGIMSAWVREQGLESEELLERSQEE